MLRLQFLITLAITMALLFTPYVHAETGGNIAINAAQVIDDRSVDILGELNYTADLFTLEVDTQLQQGNIYRGKTHAELTLLNNYKVVVDTTSKGGTWDTLGHDHNAYIAFSIPVKSLNFDIGIGGKRKHPRGDSRRLSISWSLKGTTRVRLRQSRS